ncbi:MAG: hypothetical protein PVI86_08090 [Phycisphaerae bacterium]|jgi:hypothetical protein
MQPIETWGLLLCIALAGIAIGVAGALLLGLGRERAAIRQLQRLRAFAEWQAAWLTLNRASISLVHAFRALAREAPDSTYHALRHDEAQRTRAAWCDAMSRLEEARCVLHLMAAEPPVREELQTFTPVPAESLRMAIDGTEDQVQEFHQCLGNTDHRAVAFVCASMATDVSPASWAADRIRRVVRFASSIVDNWGN